MGYLRDWIGKARGTIEGGLGLAGEKTGGGGFSRQNRSKADERSTWAFKSKTSSIIRRMKAMLVKMAADLYKSLNKSAEITGKSMVKQRKLVEKDLRRDVKKGLKVNTPLDKEKAILDKYQGKDPLIAQKRETMKSKDDLVKGLVNDKNMSVKKAEKLVGKDKDIKDFQKTIKDRNRFGNLDDKLKSVQAKQIKKTAKLNDIGLNKPDPAKAIAKKAITQGR